MPRGQTVLATWHKSKAGLYPQGSGVPVEEAKLGVMELEGEKSERHRTENARGRRVSSSPHKKSHWPRKWLWEWVWEKPALVLFPGQFRCISPSTVS